MPSTPLCGVFFFCFFFVARKSNLVVTKISDFDPSIHLCRGDILQSNNSLLVIFRWTKTIQFGERELRLPLLAIPDSILCPVVAYRQMCDLLPAQDVSPAFIRVVKDKSCPFTYALLQKTLKSLIQRTGRNPDQYSSHSLRRGGATWAFRAGVPAQLIQLQGDWRSDAYLEYLKFSLHDKIQVSQKMRDLIVGD
jgi:hypothetical protein